MLTLENKIILSWNDIQSLVDSLCDQITKNYPEIDSVHGIARGGLIPAVLISHKLNLPYTDDIKPNTLIVDDICDSGVTIENAQVLSKYNATLYHKPNEIARPTFFGEEIITSKWVIFPWEQPDAPMKQDYLQ